MDAYIDFIVVAVNQLAFARLIREESETNALVHDPVPTRYGYRLTTNVELEIEPEFRFVTYCGLTRKEHGHNTDRHVVSAIVAALEAYAER